jgi:exopolysaccharide/PEP-CTERM locus tyrosine autokinase
MAMSSIEKAIEKQSKAAGAPKKAAVPEPEVSVRSTQTASRNKTDAETFAVIPVLEQNSMLTPTLKDGQQAEEYRLIKRPLLSNASGRNASIVDRGNVIMVTSALPGEGKTYTSINLAISMTAERDRSILVIDCDVVKHSLSTMFGLDDRKGLIDVLLDPEVTIDDVIVSTDISSLKIIPAGSASNFSTELLASDQMGQIMDEMAGRYTDRLLLFDSPPLLMTSQSVILAGHAGQILIVVEEGVTPKKAVIEAISKLDESKIIGTVLNKRSRMNRSDQYGGYYGSYGG